MQQQQVFWDPTVSLQGGTQQHGGIPPPPPPPQQQLVSILVNNHATPLPPSTLGSVNGSNFTMMPATGTMGSSPPPPHPASTQKVSQYQQQLLPNGGGAIAPSPHSFYPSPSPTAGVTAWSGQPDAAGTVMSQAPAAEMFVLRQKDDSIPQQPLQQQQQVLVYSAAPQPPHHHYHPPPHGSVVGQHQQQHLVLAHQQRQSQAAGGMALPLSLPQQQQLTTTLAPTTGALPPGMTLVSLVGSPPPGVFPEHPHLESMAVGGDTTKTKTVKKKMNQRKNGGDRLVDTSVTSAASASHGSQSLTETQPGAQTPHSKLFDFLLGTEEFSENNSSSGSMPFGVPIDQRKKQQQQQPHQPPIFFGNSSTSAGGGNSSSSLLTRSSITKSGLTSNNNSSTALLSSLRLACSSISEEGVPPAPTMIAEAGASASGSGAAGYTSILGVSWNDIQKRKKPSSTQQQAAGGSSTTTTSSSRKSRSRQPKALANLLNTMKVFVRNISESTTEEEMFTFASQYGRVRSVTKQREFGGTMNCAFVTFESVETAEYFAQQADGSFHFSNLELERQRAAKDATSLTEAPLPTDTSKEEAGHEADDDTTAATTPTPPLPPLSVRMAESLEERSERVKMRQAEKALAREAAAAAAAAAATEDDTPPAVTGEDTPSATSEGHLVISAVPLTNL